MLLEPHASKMLCALLRFIKLAAEAIMASAAFALH